MIDPAMLSDKHLGAEYRELPRVFGLVRQAVARGELPTDPQNPTAYRLGKGHVRFFYSRLGFISRRYQQLCDECRSRGRQVNFGNLADLTSGIPAEWFWHWEPQPADIDLNLSRINDRGGLRYEINP